MNLFIRATRQITLLALLCVLGGCKTTDLAKDGSLASIFINGYSEDQIQQATIKVFKTNGFTQTTGLTFERPGTHEDTFMFGSLDSEKVWIRIRVHILPRGTGRYILGCDLYAVQNRGDAAMETENRLKYMKSEECLDYLNQIKAQLFADAQSK